METRARTHAKQSVYRFLSLSLSLSLYGDVDLVAGIQCQSIEYLSTVH